MNKRATQYFKLKKELRKWLIEESVENLLERYYEKNPGEKELDTYLESWYSSKSVYNNAEIKERGTL